MSVSRSRFRRGLFLQEDFLGSVLFFEGPTLETVEQRADNGNHLCIDAVDGGAILDVFGATKDVFETAKNVFGVLVVFNHPLAATLLRGSKSSG